MGEKTHCDFFLHRPSPAPAPWHQTPIHFSLQNLAKGKGSEAKKVEMVNKAYWFNYFVAGRGDWALYQFSSYIFVLGWVAWVRCLIFLLFPSQSLLYLGCSLGIPLCSFVARGPCSFLLFPNSWCFFKLLHLVFVCFAASLMFSWCVVGDNFF